MDSSSANNSPIREQPLSPVLNKKRFSRRHFLADKSKNQPEIVRNVEKRTSSIPIPIGQKGKSPPRKCTRSQGKIRECDKVKNASPRRETVVLHGNSKLLNFRDEVKERSCFIIGEEINMVCDNGDYLLEPRCSKTCSTDSMESPRNHFDFGDTAQSKLSMLNKSQLNYNIGTDESNFTLEGEIEDLENKLSIKRNRSDYKIFSTQDTDLVFANASQFHGGTSVESRENVKEVSSKDVVNVDIPVSDFDTLYAYECPKVQEDFLGFSEYNVVEEVKNYRTFMTMFAEGLKSSNLEHYGSSLSLADSPSVKKSKKSCNEIRDSMELDDNKGTGGSSMGVKRTRRASWDYVDVESKEVKEYRTLSEITQVLDDMKTRIHKELSEERKKDEKSNKARKNKSNSQVVDNKNSHIFNKIISLNQNSNNEIICFGQQNNNSVYSPQKNSELQLTQPTEELQKNKEEKLETQSHKSSPDAEHNNVQSSQRNVNEQLNQLICSTHKEESSHKVSSSPTKNKEETKIKISPRKKNLDETTKKHSSGSSKKAKSLRKIPKNKDSKTSSENEKLKNNTEVSSPVQTPENPNHITLPSSNGVQICIGNNRIKINIRTTEGEKTVKLIEGGNTLKSNTSNLNVMKIPSCDENTELISHNQIKPVLTLEGNLNNSENESNVVTEGIISESQNISVRKPNQSCSEFLNDSFSIPSQFLNDEKLEEILIAKSSPESIGISQDTKEVKDDDNLSKNIEFKNFGFSTASGKKLVVSEERMKNAAKFFEQDLTTQVDISDKNNEVVNRKSDNNKKLESESDFKFKMPSRISDYNKSKNEMSKTTPEKQKNSSPQQTSSLMQGINNAEQDLSPNPFNLMPNNLSNGFNESRRLSPLQRKPLRPKSLLKPRPEYGRPSCMQSTSRKSLNFHVEQNPSCSGDAGLNVSEIAKLQTGFALASGQAVGISKERLKTAMNIFIGIEKDVSALIDVANGKENNVMNENQLRTKENRNQSQTVLFNENHNQPLSNVINENRNQPPSNVFNENPLQHNNTRIGELNILQSTIVNENQLGVNENTQNQSKLSNNQQGLSRNQSLPNDPFSNIQSKFTPDQVASKHSGFSLASGKSVVISEDQMSRAKAYFGDALDFKDELDFGSLELEKLSQGSISTSTPAVKGGQHSEVGTSFKSVKKSSGFPVIPENQYNKGNYIVGYSFTSRFSNNKDNVLPSPSGIEIGKKNKSTSFRQNSRVQRVVYNNRTYFTSPTTFNKTKEDVENSIASGSGLNSLKNECNDNLQCKIFGAENEEQRAFGFSLASGKKVELSKDQLKKAINIYGDDLNMKENETITESTNLTHENKRKFDELKSFEQNIGKFKVTNSTKLISRPIHENNLLKKDGFSSSSDENGFGLSSTSANQPDFSGGFGFTSALGKKVDIDKDRLQNAIKIFGDDLVLNNKQQTNFDSYDPLKTQPGFGFSLASRKKLDIPKERLKKAMQVFGDDLNLKETDVEKQFDPIEEESLKISPVVIKTNVGNIDNSRKILRPVFEKKLSPSASEKLQLNEKALFSGKNVEVPKDKIKKAMELFNEDLTVGHSAGFSLASGKGVDISKDKIAMAMNLFKDIDKDLEELENSFGNDDVMKVETSKPLTERKSSEDNQTKKELFPELNEESFNEKFFAEQFSQEIKNDANINYHKDSNKSSIQESITLEKAVSSSTTEVPKHKSISKISEEYLNQTKWNKGCKDENTEKSVPEMLQDAVTAYNSVIEKCSMPKIVLTPDRKPYRKHLGMLGRNRQMNVSKEGLERGMEVFKDLDLNFGNSPIRNSNAPQCSTPKLKGCTRAMESFNLTPIKADVKKFQPIVDLGDSTIVFHEKSCGDFKQLQSDIDKEYENIKRKLMVLEERKDGLEQQKVLIESAPAAHKRQKIGVLLDSKLKCLERVPLKNLFNSGDESVDYFNIPQYIFDVTSKNSEDVHFNVASGNECLSVIKTSDDAVIIPSSSNIVGVTEVDNAFRAMVGVDPKLLHHEWVQNHYKWIVWKLASYERKFPQYFKNCLSLENVMAQLKYRYDVEIDRAKRSALRRILEKDDIPQKRMVLCVSDIMQQFGNKLELELTDGWYSVKTVIDQPLCQQIYKNKVKVGTKLMIQGADLMNCEHGTHPLDAEESVRLKINFNGTRRAHWYTKLGYYKFAAPFPICMSSLSTEGGPVSFIKIYIARAYPLKYIEKLNNAKIWRNCKAEEKRATEFDAERMIKIDSIKEKACREYQNENHDPVYSVNNANITKTDMSKISCPKTLYSLIQRSGDPESLIELLTPLQQRNVMEYKQNLNNQKQHEISMRVNKQIEELKINKRDVTAVLKLLVMDACEGGDKYYTFSVWKPSEDHLQMLKEDTSFCVYNVTFGKMGELHSSNRTYFRQNNNPLKLKKPERQLLPIAMTVDNYYKPLFGEFDTIGLIVQMHIENHQQDLWVADFNGRLLYVKIVNGPSICSLLDNLTKGQTVAISNLIKKVSKSEFGIAIANLCTVISQYPSQKYWQKGMQMFNEQLPKDLSKLLTDCDTKIEQYRKNINLSIVQNSFSINNNSTFNETDDVMEDNTSIPSRMTMTDVAMSLIDTDQFT